MRPLLIALAVLFPLAVHGQTSQPAAPKPKKKTPPPFRITVDLHTTLEGSTSKPNMMQWTIWSNLNKFHLRVDSLQPTHSKRMQSYIKKITKWMEGKYPTKGSPVHLKLVGTHVVKYNASKFYGESMAHNFAGKIDVSLQTPDGKEVANFDFKFSWGVSLSARLTKSQAFRDEYEQKVYRGLSLVILNHPTVKSGVPTYKRKKLAEWTEKERTKLLQKLDRSTDQIKKGKLARMVRKVGGKKKKKSTG